jgi:hypothetical protein
LLNLIFCLVISFQLNKSYCFLFFLRVLQEAGLQEGSAQKKSYLTSCPIFGVDPPDPPPTPYNPQDNPNQLRPQLRYAALCAQICLSIGQIRRSRIPTLRANPPLPDNPDKKGTNPTGVQSPARGPGPSRNPRGGPAEPYWSRGVRVDSLGKYGGQWGVPSRML